MGNAQTTEIVRRMDFVSANRDSSLQIVHLSISYQQHQQPLSPLPQLPQHQPQGQQLPQLQQKQLSILIQ